MYPIQHNLMHFNQPTNQPTKLLTHSLIHSLTNSTEQSPSWKGNNPQVLTKLPALYGTQRFMTVFTKYRHSFQSWATSIQSTPPILLTGSSSSSSLICQTTGPKPLAKRFLHIVRSRASSSNSQYPLLSLRSSNNFLHLLPCLLVTSIYPFIFPSITCF